MIERRVAGSVQIASQRVGIVTLDPRLLSKARFNGFVKTDFGLPQICTLTWGFDFRYLISPRSLFAL